MPFCKVVILWFIDNSLTQQQIKMKLKPTIVLLWTLWLGSNAVFTQHKDYPITPIPFSSVSIQDNFWAPKIKVNHEVTIPIAYEQSRKTGRIKNFQIAGGSMEGEFCTEYPFDDTDIYKIIEAASYSIQTFPDAEMEKMMDTLIAYIAEAQEEDGYIYTTRTIGKNVHSWAGEHRWELVHELSHELYNLGHMFEAAVAHYTATGKRTFLDIAIKSADLIYHEFGEEKILNYPGHQEVEIGLVKLYRATGDERYLNLAKFFLDVRGREGVGNPKKYDQSHLPVTQQSEAVGHAVRGSYMWTAMADIAAITGDESYMNAIDRIWHDIVDKKYYLNGGIGATGSGEAFGEAYELPNMSAYCETCAGVGNVRWNHRMFLMTGDSKYIDVLERSLYNNIIDGVSISGDHFFYPNPLASYGQHSRSEWFGCACCPPNVARTLPAMPGYIYAQQGDDIYINLYISSHSTFDIQGSSLGLKMASEFPWQGGVKIEVSAAANTKADLKLRIPGYVRNRPVPSDLYTYLTNEKQPFDILVNGEKFNYSIDAKGYVTISRSWKKGDQIAIDFPLAVEVVKSHPGVKENMGKIAIERGPILYCAEWPDNPEAKVLSLIVDADEPFEVKKSEVLNGTYTIHGQAKRASRQLDGSISVSESQALILIPYHLWNNRGSGEMSVWMATTMASVRPEPAPTIARRSSVSASKKSRAIIALNDQMMPGHSNDHSITYFHWWPKKDTEEWVQFDFEAEQEVSSVEVYWFDDGPHGGCRIPASWKVQVKSGDAWKDVKPEGEYSVTKNAWDKVQFKAVKTDALRLLIQLPKEFATGLYEVVIE